ncbi:uncharacterized protein LOC117180734 [Belonocnema kinseyi]|uniref:uncharacterized protein LOC117180734 n=1 Tax=Belonocnema kinseyi TaxID=2817044 RepID=UPI00143CD052|nr:uncharacterized protein LOC117180734 [Belonocnema kinseyi]
MLWARRKMKWQKASADLLSEKTFLILKDDLEIQAKESSGCRKKTICVGNTGTWPPKLKKKLLSDQQQDESRERPKTGILEKPNVLNPDLVDKLDMSLLSKELFSDSVSRIQLGGGAPSPSTSSSSSARRRRSVPLDTEHRQTRTGFTRRSTRKKRPAFPHSSDDFDFSRVDLTHFEQSSSLQLQKLPKSGKTVRRLDNNNNGNGSSLQSKISNSSKLKQKGAKNKISPDVELFTRFSKKAPEPCTTCGHPDQPERFHSHPKIPILKNRTGANLQRLNKISVTKKSVQKPVALNFRSDRNKKKMEKNLAAKAISERQTKTLSPLASKNNSGGLSKAGIRGFKTCYICSREFGTASFPIHEPKCLQRWERENKALPPSQRRPVPQRPDVSIDHRDWNSAAWERSQTQLVPCAICGRTFLPDRLTVHQKSCRLESKNGEIENRDLDSISNPIRVGSGPPTVVCEICGRNFGTRSIKIHEPQCLKKWQIEKEKAPKKSPLISRPEVEIPSKKSSTDSVCTRAFTCYICERNFGSASIAIHEAQCIKKWRVENNKLPFNKRRKEPQKPEETLLHHSSLAKSSLSPVELAEITFKQHLVKLVPCKQCGRTFNPDRVAVHERSCKGTR